MFTGPNPSIEAETEPQADDVLAKWVPYALVNLYLYHGWRIVTGYRPSITTHGASSLDGFTMLHLDLLDFIRPAP